MTCVYPARMDPASPPGRGQLYEESCFDRHRPQWCRMNRLKGRTRKVLEYVGRSHVSLSVLGLAETTNKPLIRVDKSVLDDAVVPSRKPLWMAATADLYPAMVEGAKGLPLCSTVRRTFKNSATSAYAPGASAGPTPHSSSGSGEDGNHKAGKATLAWPWLPSLQLPVKTLSQRRICGQRPYSQSHSVRFGVKHPRDWVLQEVVLGCDHSRKIVQHAGQLTEPRLAGPERGYQEDPGWPLQPQFPQYPRNEVGRRVRIPVQTLPILRQSVYHALRLRGAHCITTEVCDSSPMRRDPHGGSASARIWAVPLSCGGTTMWGGCVSHWTGRPPGRSWLPICGWQPGRSRVACTRPIGPVPGSTSWGTEFHPPCWYRPLWWNCP